MELIRFETSGVGDLIQELIDFQVENMINIKVRVGDVIFLLDLSDSHYTKANVNKFTEAMLALLSQKQLCPGCNCSKCLHAGNFKVTKSSDTGFSKRCLLCITKAKISAMNEKKKRVKQKHVDEVSKLAFTGFHQYWPS